VTKPRTALFFLFLSAAALWGTPVQAEEAFSQIPMTKVDQLLGKPGVFVFDMNTPETWEQYHLPGAVHVDNPDLARFLPPDKNATILFYCFNQLCDASAAAAREASSLGYQRLSVMKEGIIGWVKSGRPIERGKSAKKPGSSS
jgi:rhodanese-related sulfurtransferase